MRPTYIVGVQRSIRPARLFAPSQFCGQTICTSLERPQRQAQQSSYDAAKDGGRRDFKEQIMDKRVEDRGGHAGNESLNSCQALVTSAIALTSSSHLLASAAPLQVPLSRGPVVGGLALSLSP